jgi:hypothetical protein
MFDFEAGAPKAPKVFLDPTNGEVSGEEGGKPGSGPGGSGGDGGPGGSGGDGGSGGGKPHEKVHCKVYGHGRHVELSCTVSGGRGRGAVRFRIEHGKQVLGTSSAALKGTKATSTVTTKGNLSGKYTLLATVSRTDGVDALSQSVVLPGKGSVDLH